MITSCCLNDLSEDVIQNLLFEYLSYEEKIQFIMTNTNFTHRFLKSTRRITKKSRSMMKNPETRQRIASLIEDPYHQLDLKLLSLQDGICGHGGITIDASSEVNLAPLTSVNILEVGMKPFLRDFQNIASQIQEFHVLKWPVAGGVTALLSYLTERKEETSLRLRHLEISICEEEEDQSNIVFPFIPTLVSLELHEITNRYLSSQYYQTLQKLVLDNCKNLEDVSELGNIYDLTLIDCPLVVDISALQNNHRIMIEDCVGIKDYSRSFRNSVHITIDISCYYQVPFSASSLISWGRVQSLTLIGLVCDEPCVFPLPLSLKCCTFGSTNVIPFLTFIGYQHLRQVCIRNIHHVISMELLGSISILELRYCYRLNLIGRIRKGESESNYRVLS